MANNFYDTRAGQRLAQRRFGATPNAVANPMPTNQGYYSGSSFVPFAPSPQMFPQMPAAAMQRAQASLTPYSTFDPYANYRPVPAAAPAPARRPNRRGHGNR